MTFILALLIALSALLTGPSQAHAEAPTQPLTQATQAPITAPTQALSYEAPTVTTSPAPQALSQAPIQAPVEAPQVAPIPQGAPIQQAPTQAPERPTAAPGCMEDEPCWDCTVNDNRTCINGVPLAPAGCEEDMECWDCTAEDNRICIDGVPQAPTWTVDEFLAGDAPVLTPQGVNPECSEQSMQTAPDGTCMTETECAVAGESLDAEGNCTAKENG